MFRTEKFVHIIMVIVLAVVCLGCTALAEEVPYSFTYTTLADGTLSITGVYGDTSGTVEVPGAIDGVAVTQIGYGAFRFASVEEVILPDGITYIDNSAFQYCYDLKKINIPDGVVSIDNYAFYENQSLKEITIPDSVTSIGTYAFSDCYDLEKVTLSAGLDKIDQYTFAWCERLKEIAIPEGVTSIADDAFYSSESLQKVELPDSLVSIGNYAFEWCDLRELTVPDSVIRIGDSAFAYNDDLKKATLPKDLAAIPSCLFEGCEALTEVVMPEKLTYIGSSAFSGCDLAEALIPDTVTSVGSYAFENNKRITKAKYPANITAIPNGLYRGCNLSDQAIPKTVTSIGEWAFAYNKSLTKAVFTDGMTTVPEGIYAGCTGITSVTIPDTVTSIGDSAFEGTGITEIVIPDSVTTMGDYAFCGCEKLTKVKLPAGLTVIPYNAFAWCDNLTEIDIPETVTTIGYYAFEGTGIKNVELPAGLTTIQSSAFAYSALTEIVIPDSVTNMGYGVFEGCEDLESVTLPKGITTVPESIFYDCISLRTVNLPDTIKIIEYDAFGYSGIRSIDLPDGLEEIQENAFRGSKLSEIVIPESVTDIEYGVFSNSNIRNVTFPSTLTYISGSMFSSCKNLDTMVIPGTIKTIREWAFEDSSIRGLILEEGVEAIGAFAFWDTDMEYIVIPASVTSIGADFEGDDYNSNDAVFDEIDMLYVIEGSAGHTYAVENELPFTLYGAEGLNVMLGVEGDGRTVYAVGDTGRFTAKAMTEETLKYYFRMYCDGEVVLSRWQYEDVLEYTFDKPGNYSLKVAARNEAGLVTEYRWFPAFEVVEELPEAPVISNLQVYTPQNISIDTPIMWSFTLTGGTGRFTQDVSDMFSWTINGEEDEEGPYIEWVSWGVPGGKSVRASFVPNKAGVYEFTMKAEDSSGDTTETVTLPAFTVKQGSFRITGVTADYVTIPNPDYDPDYPEYDPEFLHYTNIGDTVTWKVDTTGAKGDVVYTLKVIGFNEYWGDSFVWEQKVSRSPEISVTFEKPGYEVYAYITAFDEGSGTISCYKSDAFSIYEEGDGYFPYDWYIYSEGEFEVGSRNFWYIEAYDELLDLLADGTAQLRCEFYLDGELYKELDWGEWAYYGEPVSVIFDKPGEVYAVFYIRDDKGYYNKIERWYDVTGGEGGEEGEGGEGGTSYPDSDLCIEYTWLEYSEENMDDVEVRVDYYDDAEDCWDYNCGHGLLKLTVYKDGEVYKEYDWQSGTSFSVRLDDYGYYTYKVELKEIATDTIVDSDISYLAEPVKPYIAAIDLGTLGRNGVWTGQYLTWTVYAEGGIHPVTNEIKATLYKDGEVYKEFDWDKCVAAETYNSGGFHSERSFTELMSAPGIYTMSAQVRDAKGNVSELYTSGEVYVASFPNAELEMQSIHISDISLELADGKTIRWDGISFGGVGEVEYQFVVLKDGEVVKTYDWQTANSIYYKPTEVGSYQVQVAVRDSEGNTSGPITSFATVVFDPIERTITELDISAETVYARVGDKFRLDLVIEPDNPSVKGLDYSTSDAKVATVSRTGLIEVVGNGDAVITLATRDGSEITRTLNLHVEDYSVIVPPTALTLIDSEAFMGSAVSAIDLSGNPGVTLADNAFDGCRLLCVYLPDTITIGDNAFGSETVVFSDSEAQSAIAREYGIDYIELQ